MGDKHRLIYFAERIERMSASAQQGIQQHVTRPGRATSTNKRPSLHAMGPEAVLAQHVHFRISRTHVRREGAPAQALRPGRIQSSTRYPTIDLDPGHANETKLRGSTRVGGDRKRHRERRAASGERREGSAGTAHCRARMLTMMKPKGMTVCSCAAAASRMAARGFTI